MNTRLHPYVRNRWLGWVLPSASWALLLGGAVLATRPALSASDAIADYLPGAFALAGGLFGLVLDELLGLLQDIYERIAQAEFELSKRSREMPAKPDPASPPA